ncbi:MAG: type VII secretion protein EssC, partial [Lactococcus sp.]|nr:type VII secretion protein EssC [Lactococcus sp.]MDN6106282.1 type VII secretion protein EssC [Lactococcus sp.]
LGQYELMYDPTEEVVQGKDTSDLPSQLDAVITEITHIFEGASYTRPDQPWLPNLAENIPTPQANLGSKPTLSVPLGLLDIPSDQAQVNYDFDLLKQGNTVIFASSGYGKSTLLQTLSLNLAKANTPEQVHLNLLDFGNNGLLPLKDLPHVADIVTLEETEKGQKMLAGIVATLASRKRAFKTAGVASLEQYESKTQLSLPIIVNLLDNYDGLSLEDSHKQQIDNSLLQVLREGPSMGVYLVLTASRLGAIRANMMSAIPTKLILYLNDAGEVTTIMGRASVQQEAKAGRGQVMLDVQGLSSSTCQSQVRRVRHY